MSERFCPFCGRANRSDLPRCMNCGQRMIPAPPTADQVTGGRSVLLQEADETQTIAARTGNHEPWWRTPDGSPFGTIPPPPQVREEQARFEARETAKESARRAEQAAKDAAAAHARKKATDAVLRAAEKEQTQKNAASITANASAKQTAQFAQTAQSAMECLRCGTVPPPGGGFSFCLSCGGDLSGRPVSSFGKASASSAARPSVSAASARPTVANTASYSNASAAATGIVGLQKLHETDSKAGYFPPGVAAVLSFFVPGIGQIINGQVAKGVVLLLASFFVTTVLTIPTMGLLPIIGRVIAALDAYRVAERRRKGETVRPDEWDLG